VDAHRTRELVALARPMRVTFHRAFDMARDPYQALETLIDLGVDRVLTTGQESSVLEGLDLIADLIQKAGDRIIIMPGGGITTRNFEKIVAGCGVKEVHVLAPATRESPMTYRNPNCFMGGELRPPEFSLTVTDPDHVQAFVTAAQKM
jgi:copper homeostasis protein